MKRQKNDAADAEAICEAVTRPNMRFVVTKTPEQQSCLMLHRTRHLFIRQQTSVINAIRPDIFQTLAAYAPVGRQGVEQLLGVVSDASDKRLPDVARACVATLGAQLQTLRGSDTRVRSHDQSLAPIQRGEPPAGEIYQASVRLWRPLWLPASLIRRCSGQEGTSRLGLG